jgi:cytochrome P450
VQAVKASRDYFRGLVAERRKSRSSDLISALIAAEDEGDKLSEGELLSTCTLLLIAGHETTVNLIGNGVLQLLQHPDELAKFRAEPDRRQWSRRCCASTRRCSSTDASASSRRRWPA